MQSSKYIDPAVLDAILETCRCWREPDHEPRALAVQKTLSCNNRFTSEGIAFAVNQQTALVTGSNVERWLGRRGTSRECTIGVVNPANVPFAGFQDLLAVLLLGHRYVGKLSTRSPHLLAAFVQELRGRLPNIRAQFASTDHLLDACDALILTGRDETIETLSRRASERGIDETRILARGHRYSCAIIAGDESQDTLERLAEDVLLHDGAGCRSPAVLWAPAGTSPDSLLEAMAYFRAVFPAHPDTRGNLKMQIALNVAFETSIAYGDDESFLVTKGEPEPQSPGHLRWTEYERINEIKEWLRERSESIQLVVASPSVRDRLTDFQELISEVGDAQRPGLGWRQGTIDVADFIESLG